MHASEDPRFRQGVTLFNEEEFAEAADLFEELFQEAVLDEVEFIRMFMQISAAAHHVERRQLRAAEERLVEGILALERWRDSHGFDVAALRSQLSAFGEAIGRRAAGDATPMKWPRL